MLHDLQGWDTLCVSGSRCVFAKGSHRCIECVRRGRTCDSRFSGETFDRLGVEEERLRGKLLVILAHQEEALQRLQAEALRLHTEIQQAISELSLEAIGYYAMPFVRDTWAKTNVLRPGPENAAPVAPYYFNLRKASIYAGSNEIQRNIMAKAVLGL